MDTYDTVTADADPRDHLSLVADMTRDFADSRDIDAALARGLSRIASKLRAEAASLFVLDAATGDLVCRACTGPVDIKGLRISSEVGIVGRTIREVSAQLVADTAHDPDFGAEVDRATGFATRSILAAPLHVQDETLGAIELINKRGEASFDSADARSLEALAAAAGLALINARNAEAMAAQAALQRELTVAAQIQQSFLPDAREAAFPIHGRNVPAREVSGDFFDIVEPPGGHIWFAVGDVSGKGINAALMMARTTSLFRYLAKTADDPAAVLAAINTELVDMAAFGMFVTMTCGVYAPETGELLLANAGHEPALQVATGDPGAVRWHGAQTPPLALMGGLFTDPPAESQRLDLTGKYLYVFTDGLTETRLPGGHFLGADGVAHRLARAEAAGLDAPGVIDRVIDDLAPANGAPGDDLTLVRVAGRAG